MAGLFPRLKSRGPIEADILRYHPGGVFLFPRLKIAAPLKPL